MSLPLNSRHFLNVTVLQKKQNARQRRQQRQSVPKNNRQPKRLKFAKRMIEHYGYY